MSEPDVSTYTNRLREMSWRIDECLRRVKSGKEKKDDKKQ